MRNTVQGIQMPLVSQEFIDQLAKVFPGPVIDVGFDRDTVMKAVGQREVVEWIRHHALGGRTVTGDVKVVDDKLTTGAVVKYGK